MADVLAFAENCQCEAKLGRATKTANSRIPSLEGSCDGQETTPGSLWGGSDLGENEEVEDCLLPVSICIPYERHVPLLEQVKERVPTWSLSTSDSWSPNCHRSDDSCRADSPPLPLMGDHDGADVHSMFPLPSAKGARPDFLPTHLSGEPLCSDMEPEPRPLSHFSPSSDFQATFSESISLPHLKKQQRSFGDDHTSSVEDWDAAYCDPRPRFHHAGWSGYEESLDAIFVEPADMLEETNASRQGERPGPLPAAFQALSDLFEPEALAPAFLRHPLPGDK